MEIPDQLIAMFSGRIEERDGVYVVEIPEREIQLGSIDENSAHRVAILPTPSQPDQRTKRQSETENNSLEPPVEEGDTRVVDIESVGDQGDGICRVERGYVVIVPDTEKGERVRIEIAQVRENVAFADVVERLDYYE
jgi:predicted RNA-binding protein with TRAM domain